MRLSEQIKKELDRGEKIYTFLNNKEIKLLEIQLEKYILMIMKKVHLYGKNYLNLK